MFWNTRLLLLQSCTACAPGQGQCVLLPGMYAVVELQPRGKSRVGAASVMRSQPS